MYSKVKEQSTWMEVLESLWIVIVIQFIIVILVVVVKIEIVLMTPIWNYIK